MKEVERCQVVASYIKQFMSAEEAALAAGMTVRNFRRLVKKYRVDGPEGLMHGNRGKPARNRIEPAIERVILEIAAGMMKGAGYPHIHEKVAQSFGAEDCKEVEARIVSKSTVRRKCIAAHLPSYKKYRVRKSSPKSVPRVAKAGGRLETDGSEHN